MDSKEDMTNELDDINILLLGSTGVSKSTFINAIANYLQYESYEEAESKGLVVSIPIYFQITDKQDQEQEVHIDARDSKNECLEVGESATQRAGTYTFRLANNRIIRFIDTPGVGDTRGIDHDNRNFEDVLSLLGKFEKLHAICYIFVSGQLKNSHVFEYYLNQIFSRLDKSTSNNFIFLYTNSKGQNFNPGDASKTLQKVLVKINKNSSVDIPYKKNMFCFENEAIRYLAVAQKNIELAYEYKDGCIIS